MAGFVTQYVPTAPRVAQPLLPSRQAPEVVCFCTQCQRDTGTSYRQFRNGLVGNTCLECGRCRRLRPYVPKSYLSATFDAASAAKEDSHERRRE
jgi:hypothetical protein